MAVRDLLPNWNSKDSLRTPIVAADLVQLQEVLLNYIERLEGQLLNSSNLIGGEGIIVTYGTNNITIASPREDQIIGVTIDQDLVDVNAINSKMATEVGIEFTTGKSVNNKLINLHEVIIVANKSFDGRQFIWDGNKFVELIGSGTDQFALKIDLQALEQTVKDLSDKVNENVTDLESLIKAVGQLEESIDKNTSDVSTNKNNIAINTNGITINLTSISNINSSLSVLTGEVEDHEKRLGVVEGKVETLEEKEKQLSGVYQTKKVNPDGNFNGGDTVQERFDDAGVRIKTIETHNGEQDGRLDDAETESKRLDTAKQQKEATTNISDFNSTNMEVRDKENFDKAKSADDKAEQALSEIKALQVTGELATYTLDATSAIDVAETAGDFVKISFDEIQTNDGNVIDENIQPPEPKIESDLTIGTIKILNSKYPSRKWVISSKMVLRKTANAGTNDPVVNLMLSDDGGVNSHAIETYVINDLRSVNSLHSFAVTDKIINGLDYDGKDIWIWLEINTSGETDINISQVRTFGVNEKASGAPIVTSTEKLIATDSTTEGGGNQKIINEANKKVAEKTTGITKDGNGKTIVDTVAIQEFFDRLKGYTLDSGSVVVDGIKIVETFNKLLDVPVNLPDAGVQITLGELLSNPTKITIPVLPLGQSLIDRTKLKLKQVYREGSESEEEYFARLFDEISIYEAFVDGFNNDFNINWSQSKTDWDDGVTDGVQIWNSIRINSDLTIDFLKKTLTKPKDYDLTTNPCTLVNESNVKPVIAGRTNVTQILNDIVDRVLNDLSDIKELNEGNFDVKNDGTLIVKLFDNDGNIIKEIKNELVLTDTEEQSSIDTLETLVDGGL